MSNLNDYKARFMHTWKLISRLADHVSFGKIAQLSGITLGTAESWGREPESNANPFGTGRKNVLDGALRMIALAHKEDPALAREMAEVFTDYVDYLDKRQPRQKGSINSLIGHSAKEHMDVVLAILNTERPDWRKAYTEIKQEQAAMYKVELFVKGEMREEAA